MIGCNFRDDFRHCAGSPASGTLPFAVETTPPYHLQSLFSVVFNS